MDVEWFFTPVAGGSVFGYDRATNKSYTSTRLPAGVTAERHDGLNALFIPKATELSLGDFAGTCLSNPTLCADGAFTVSFFMKAKEITENELHIFDSGEEMSAFGWGVAALNNSFSSNPQISGERGTTNSLEGTSYDQLPNNGSWFHVTFVSPNSSSWRSLKIYVNGHTPDDQAASASSPKYNADIKTVLTAGSPDNDRGFYVALLQFKEEEMRADDVGALYRQSLQQGKYCSPAQLRVDARLQCQTKWVGTLGRARALLHGPSFDVHLLPLLSLPTPSPRQCWSLSSKQLS